jgi:hypothetical protein
MTLSDCKRHKINAETTLYCIFTLFFAKKLIVGWKRSSKGKKTFTVQPTTQNRTLHEKLGVTQLSRNLLTFRKRLLLPSSGQKRSFTPRNEVVHSVNIYKPTRRHIPEDSDLYPYHRQNIEYRLGSALFSEICFRNFLHLRPHFNSSVFSSDFLTQTFYAFLVYSHFLHVSRLLLSKLLHSPSTFKVSPRQSNNDNYQILLILFQILLKNNKL